MVNQPVIVVERHRVTGSDPLVPDSPKPTAPLGVPLSLVAERLPDAALLVDHEARVVWGNQAASRLFGMPLAEAVGRSGLDFLHPDDLQLAALSLESVRGKDVGTPIELRVRGADGWRLVEMVGAPFDSMVLLNVRDLTDRRRWEVAGDEVARYRSLMQNSTSITMLLARDGAVTASSGGVTRLLGVDQELLEGQPMQYVVHDDDHQLLDAALAQQLASGSNPAPLTVDLRLARSDGRAVPFALTFTNLLDDPTVEGVVVTGHDVSDRVRTEADLRAANSVLAATLESTADGILVVDHSGRIASFNSRFAEMWQLPSHRAGHDDDELLISMVLEQLCDPAAFLSTTQELHDDPESHSHDVLEFKDGRVFERDSLPQRIDGRVVGRVWSFRDITETRRMQQELVHQASHDSLTGLANQALFRDRTTQAVGRLERDGGSLAVLFVDLDDFKTVNDSLGHSVGDALLVAVSKRLMTCLRPCDTVARLGGDEFAVLVEDIEPGTAAATVAQRIIDVLHEPVTLSGRPVSTTASVGIAYAAPGLGADEMLRNADLAMYTAKAAGKNCHRVFTEQMHSAALERLDLETHLRGAADRGELVVHYQPIVELGGERIVAMEALVRWAHPERGLLGPLSFIPFAEESPLIEEIGHHVLVTSCEEAARWADSVGPDAPAISVNLSPRQLMDPRLPDRVELLLHRCGLDPAQLILEITEGALMRDPEAAVVSLDRISRLGVRLAVDDFGTGYSSLAYLEQFPVDLLKIDGAFVDDSLGDRGSSLAETIVQISHALGLVPIAEGVETSAQSEALASFGCDLAQGFHFGRPVAAEATRDLIANSIAGDAGGIHVGSRPNRQG